MQIHAKSGLQNVKLLCLHNTISASLAPNTDSAAKDGATECGAKYETPRDPGVLFVNP